MFILRLFKQIWSYISNIISGYAEEIKKLLFSQPQSTFTDTIKQYEAKIPEPLNRQFSQRRTREEAIKRWAEKRSLRTELCPPGTNRQLNTGILFM